MRALTAGRRVGRGRGAGAGRSTEAGGELLLRERAKRASGQRLRLGTGERGDQPGTNELRARGGGGGRAAKQTRAACAGRAGRAEGARRGGGDEEGEGRRTRGGGGDGHREGEGRKCGEPWEGAGSLEEAGRGRGAWRRGGERERGGGREPGGGEAWGQGAGASEGEGNHVGGGKGRSAEWRRGAPEGRAQRRQRGDGGGERLQSPLPHSLRAPTTLPPSLAGGAGGWARSAFFPEPAVRAVPRPGWRSGPLAPGSFANRGRPIPGGSGQVRERGAGSGRTSRAPKRT